MKIYFASFILSFFLFLSDSRAQSYSGDTIFLTKDYDTCFAQEAYYTRVSKKENDRIAIVNYYKNGAVAELGVLQLEYPHKKLGYFKSFQENGNLSSEGNYVDGEPDGLWKFYSDKGELKREVEYSNGDYDGKLISYYDSKRIKREDFFKKGKLVNGKCYSFSGADTTYWPFHEMPTFKGGEAGLKKYLIRNVKYPKISLKTGKKGTVNVRFVINTEGKVEKVKIENSIDSVLDAEAKRVIMDMPKWGAGKVDGVKAKYYYRIPIKFQL